MKDGGGNWKKKGEYIIVVVLDNLNRMVERSQLYTYYVFIGIHGNHVSISSSIRTQPYNMLTFVCIALSYTTCPTEWSNICEHICVHTYVIAQIVWIHGFMCTISNVPLKNLQKNSKFKKKTTTPPPRSHTHTRTQKEDENKNQ